MKPLKYYLKKNIYTLPEDIQPKVYNIDNCFSIILDKFKQKQPFYYVRFGDGEFVTMMGKNHRNYKYNSNLAKEIEDSLRIEDQDYLIGLPVNYEFDRYWVSGVYKHYTLQDQINKMFVEKKMPINKTYHNSFVFQCLLLMNHEPLKNLMQEYIRPMKKMFIGGAGIEDAEILYGKIDYYIQTPFKHAYERIDEWWPLVEKNMNDVELIIPSIGSSSNVVQLRLWNLGVRCYVIDFGSMIDAVGLKKSRGWIKKQGHKILKIIPNNSIPVTYKQRFNFLIKDFLFFIRRQIN